MAGHHAEQTPPLSPRPDYAQYSPESMTSSMEYDLHHAEDSLGDEGLALPRVTKQSKTARAGEIVPIEIVKIACIGAGHVGGPSCAVIAYHNPHLQVTVIDHDRARIDAWNSPALPIHEPGLDHLVQLCRDGIIGGQRDDGPPLRRRPNLAFSTDMETAVLEADLIFVSVNTPLKATGIGQGVASDLGSLEAATRTIAHVARQNKIVVEKSTVPCRTAEVMSSILEANAQPGVRFDVLSNPEFLAEGTAVTDLSHPDRVLIGSLPTTNGFRAAAALASVYGAWVPADRIITMNLWSSELSKLAANALLAQRISSINALSALCEATGADVDEVAYACGLDSRIGSRMLKAGPGFGGSCFTKDVLSLVYLAESRHLPEVAAYWKSVVTINEYQKSRFAKRIVECLFNTVRSKTIAILGFAYKKDTGDTRESAAIGLVLALAAEGAQIRVYDPVVQEAQIWQALWEPDQSDRSQNLYKLVTVSRTPYEACHDADAVVVMTEWDEFSNKIRQAQSSPALAGTTHDMDPDRVALAQMTTSASTVSIKSLSGKLEKVLSNGSDGRATPTVAASMRALSSSTMMMSPSSASALTSTPHNNSSAMARMNQLTLTPMSMSTASPAGKPSVAATSASRKATAYLSVDGDGDGPARLDWERVAAHLKKPKWVFDGRNILDAEKLEKLGLRVERIGKPRPATTKP
ncbi:MAG: UDP-glucose 6-dehydrogenase 1 [Thelocarpon superellum]|nr:MAG: UDP-glucose 6-dehydrogenase 1 [Thelocarpon superellum]